MKRIHIIVILVGLTGIVILLGAFKSNLPAVQYLGNTAGVLLGFILGIGWQETERERIRKEREAERNQCIQENIQQFWNEYKTFLLEFEKKVDNLKTKTSRPDMIYETVFEHRLPLPEARHFEKRAGELGLDKNTRWEIQFIAEKARLVDEYIDMGAEKLKRWHQNFSSHVNDLWLQVRDLNSKHSKKTAT